MDQIRHIFNIYQIKNRYCDIMLLHVKISFFKTQFMTELLLPLLVVAYCLEISLYVYICPCMYLCLLLMPYAFYICPFMVSTIMTAHSYVWILVNIEQIQFLQIFLLDLHWHFSRVGCKSPTTLEMEFVVIIVVARFLDSPFIQKRLLMINLVKTNTGVLELID